MALDGELNREVALKEILDRHADDPSCRARFLIEAEITGALEHPGIVPVYGLGRYRDGRPHYAMRFIRGDSLQEAIAAFHEDPTLKTAPGRKSLALRKLLRRSAGEASGLAGRAMADLRQAVATGYRNPADYRRESALDPLRGRDDFRMLILDLAFPSDPFTR